MVIIILGAPATGKGTVSAILNEKLESPHVSSGDIFRKYSSEETITMTIYEFIKFIKDQIKQR